MAILFNDHIIIYVCKLYAAAKYDVRIENKNTNEKQL